jgi:hypothetical protein
MSMTCILQHAVVCWVTTPRLTRVQRIHSAYDQRCIIRIHKVCTTHIYNRWTNLTKLLECSRLLPPCHTHRWSTLLYNRRLARKQYNGRSCQYGRSVSGAISSLASCRPPDNGLIWRLRQQEPRIKGADGRSGRWLPHSQIASASQEGHSADHSEETSPDEWSLELHNMSQPTLRHGKFNLGTQLMSEP